MSEETEKYLGDLYYEQSEWTYQQLQKARAEREKLYREGDGSALQKALRREEEAQAEWLEALRRKGAFLWRGTSARYYEKVAEV